MTTLPTITLEVSHRFSHAADKVWQMAGDFGGLLAWLPGVTACRVEGSGAAAAGGNAERLVTLLDGSITRERLESLDDANRRYEYSILEAKGFTADNEYRATFQVLPVDAASSEVRWGVRLRLPAGVSADKQAKLKTRIEQTYVMFLQNLQNVLAQS
ncbi:MAG: SRPBCC family protein [Pseudomonadota bacterium]